MHILTRCLKGAIAVLLIVSHVPVLQAQDSTCVDVIEKAEEAYFNIQFERAVSLLAPCKDQFEQLEQRQEAYLLLARIHFSTQDVQLSRKAIHQVLITDDSYSVPNFLPPPFVSFFTEIQDGFEQHIAFAEKLYPVPDFVPLSIWQRVDKHWYWVSGGLFVASVAALINNDPTPGSDVFARPPSPPGAETPGQ